MAAEKPLTLRQMVRNTPRGWVDNAKDTRIVSARSVWLEGRTRKRIEAIAQTDVTTARKHLLYIESLDGPSLSAPNSRVKVSCDCLTGDTKVLTTLGWKTMRELAEPLVPDSYPISYQIKGETHLGSAPFFKGKQPVWKIHLKNGKTISATKDHKLLKYGGYKRLNEYKDGKYVKPIRVQHKNKWTSLKNLKVGDKLVLNSYDADYDIDPSSVLDGFFLGVIMGDGSLFREGHPDLQLYKKDKQEIIDALAQTGTVIDTVKVQKDGIRVRFNHRAKELLARYKFLNKESVDIQSPSHLFGYLAGLLVTDGRCGGGYFTVCGDFRYLSQLQDKLFEYGMHDVFLTKERAKGAITNLGVATKDMYCIRIGTKTTAKLLPYVEHLITADKMEVLAYEKTSTQRREPCVEIVDITYDGRRDVYDIIVPNVNKFVANGIIVHNCGAFMYTFEAALHHHGNADIIHSNGAFPQYTNPRLVGGLCKHLVKVALYAIHKGI